MLPAEEIGASLASEGSSITRELDSALASGNGAAVQVHLSELYAFFGRLGDVYDQLHATETALTGRSAVSAVTGLVDELKSFFSGPGIPGVDAAMAAAKDAVSGDSSGLAYTVRSIKGVVAQNMQAVSDTYRAYLAADADGASQLSSAVAGRVNSDWQALDVAAPVTQTYGGGGKVIAI